MIVWKENYSFAPITSTTTDSDGHISQSVVIAIIERNTGIVMQYTRLTKYIVRAGNRHKNNSHTHYKTMAKYICQFMNWLMSCLTEFDINSPTELTGEMVWKYFDDYSEQKTAAGHNRSKADVQHAVFYITHFLLELINAGKMIYLKEEDLFSYKTISNNKSRSRMVRIPKYKPSVKPSTHQEHFKDLPDDAVNMLIQLSIKYAPDITVGLCLGFWAGLRVGEICSVRRNDSVYGPGIIWTRNRERITGAEVVLDDERNLRDDGVISGLSKTPRNAHIEKEFLDRFVEIYAAHLKKYKPSNIQISPLLINRDGKAMTTAVFSNKFKKLVGKYFVSALLQADDAALQLAGQYILERGMTPHVMRHWFSTYCARKLPANPSALNILMTKRRDKHPESAMPYLIGKGIISSALEEIQENAYGNMMQIKED